jgi:hypothetical protein
MIHKVTLRNQYKTIIGCTLGPILLLLAWWTSQQHSFFGLLMADRHVKNKVVFLVFALAVAGFLLLLTGIIQASVTVAKDKGTIRFRTSALLTTTQPISAVTSVFMRKEAGWFGCQREIPVLDMAGRDYRIAVFPLVWSAPFGLGRGSATVQGELLAKHLGVPFLPNGQHASSLSA